MMLDWIVDVLPHSKLMEVVKRFEIDEIHVMELCSTLYRFKRQPRIPSSAEAQKFRDRQAVFRTAIEQFREMTGNEFVMLRGKLVFTHPAPPPPGDEQYAGEPGIPAKLFEDMLQALVDQDDSWLRFYQSVKADRQTLGNNVKHRRHALWFGFLVFWYHELGRSLTITIDPDTGKPGGALVEFIAAASSHALVAKDRTYPAIAGFIRRNKARAIEDPEFGYGRLMHV